MMRDYAPLDVGWAIDILRDILTRRGDAGASLSRVATVGGISVGSKSDRIPDRSIADRPRVQAP